MLADDLRVTPMSSISTMSYLNRSKVPLSDLEEIDIKIGVKEVNIFTRLQVLFYVVIYLHLLTLYLLFVYMLQCLSIRKASIISTFSLTNGLKQFIPTIKVEK